MQFERVSFFGRLTIRPCCQRVGASSDSHISCKMFVKTVVVQTSSSFALIWSMPLLFHFFLALLYWAISTSSLLGGPLLLSKVFTVRVCYYCFVYLIFYVKHLFDIFSSVLWCVPLLIIHLLFYLLLVNLVIGIYLI